MRFLLWLESRVIQHKGFTGIESPIEENYSNNFGDSRLSSLAAAAAAAAATTRPKKV
jgi:hypothetical protein